MEDESKRSFPDHNTPFNVFSPDIYLYALVKIIVQQGNLYIQQNGREFPTNVEEKKLFPGTSYVMTVPIIAVYYGCA